MKADTFKVGIIGIGYIGKIHLEELSRVEGVEVVAIADANAELVKDIGTRYGIKGTYSDWKKLINDENVEIIHNCTPNNLHFEVNQRVIESGKEIFSEKPLAWNHERPSELWIGKRNEANETFFESPILQDKSTQHYATLPSGHPMGYRDAIVNLFRDYYSAIRDKREGHKTASIHPDFIAGHNEMLILKAALESSKQGTWTEVKYNDV